MTPGRDPLLDAALRAGRAERPDAQARQRTLAALGLVGAAGVTLGASQTTAQAATHATGAAQAGAQVASASAAAATGAAGGTSAAAGAAAGSTAAAGLGAGLVAKWVGVSVVSLAVSGSVWQLATTPAAPRPTVATAAVATTGAPLDPLGARGDSTARGASPGEMAEALDPSPEQMPPDGEAAAPPPSGQRVAAPRPAPAGAAASPQAASPQAASPQAASTVADEIAALEVARASLRRRDAAGAQAALGAYRARFPRGTLASEVFPIQIEALALTDLAAARAQVAAFLARHPDSLYAPRLRAAVGLVPSGPTP